MTTMQDLLNEKVDQKVRMALSYLAEGCYPVTEIDNILKSHSTFGPKAWDLVREKLTAKMNEVGGMQSADIAALLEVL